MTDGELLRLYVKRREERAFLTLVERHAGMVYSAALRQVCDPGMAEDVTQGVFILMAQKSPALQPETSLSGWLLKATHYCVRDAQKATRRRMMHERRAGEESLRAREPDDDHEWDVMVRQLDGALAELGEKERSALALKFFANRTLEEVGKELGITKEGAAKRVTRGIANLRAVLARRGVAMSAGAMGAGLLARPADAVMPGLAVILANRAMKTPLGSTTKSAAIAKGAWKMLVAAKVKSAVAGVLVVAAVIAATAVPLVQVMGQQGTTGTAGAVAESDTVRPGDLLCVGVGGLRQGEVETLKTAHVNVAGEVSLLYVGAVKIGGMRFDEAEKAIAARYKEAQLLVETLVTVNRLGSGGETRTLGAGDRVSIRIEELAGPGEEVRRVLPVSGEGNVGLPLIGQVHIGGLDEGQAEAVIAKSYEEHLFLQKGVVSVVRLTGDEKEEPTVERMRVMVVKGK
jgi:RNA polymerase sigma factor (sigma-70 family)